MPKVLIIEDEQGIQITLQDRLQIEGYEVSVESNGIQGEAAAAVGSFDILLLDVMLPDRDGFAVCRNLRAAGIETPILMLTARNTNLDTVMGLRQGADDYLTKPFDMGVLLARMEALLRRAAQQGAGPGGRPGNRPAAESGDTEDSGDTGDAGGIIRFGLFSLDRESRELFQDREVVDLHTREYQLLEYMACRPGRLLSRDQILDEVWGYESETSTRTVDVHIARIRRKLGEHDFPRHIQTVRGRGYKFLMDP